MFPVSCGYSIDALELFVDLVSGDRKQEKSGGCVYPNGVNHVILRSHRGRRDSENLKVFL